MSGRPGGVIFLTNVGPRAFRLLTEAQFWDHEIRRLNIPTAPTIVLHGVMGILEMAENFHEVSLGLF